MKKIIFVAFIFLLSGLCYGAQKELSKIDNILLTVEEKTKDIKDIQFDYVQDVVYKLANEHQNYSGVVKYKDRTHIYMIQKEPQQHYTYINDNKVTNYVPENKQAIVENWNNVLSNDVIIMTILDFNSNIKSFKKNNIVELVEETDKVYKLNISSIKTKSEWKISVELNKETMLIDKAVCSNENCTLNITLKNYKLNNGFHKNMFKFVAPEDVEVIEF